MLNKYFKEKAALIDAALGQMIIPVHPYSDTIFDAMKYSLFAGGKRLRPILLMAAADASGGDGTSYLPVACGLEMIHTYSLIHDDLPAMDDDDYRRGKLTSHKVFGEGMAILTGDALLTLAFETMLSQKDVPADRLIKVIKDISVAAGPTGMIAGQVVDLLSEGKTIDAETVKYMHQTKTGALFKAAIKAGAVLANADELKVNNLCSYAEQFGLAFQITDDILDVIGDQEKIGKPVGSDIRNNKATYVSLYSIEGAKHMAEKAVKQASAALESFGPEADILRELVEYLLIRDK